MKTYSHQLQKAKNTTKLQKKILYELNKRKTLIRKRNQSNREIKQNGRKQERENIVEDVDIGRFFELSTTNKKYVNGLNLHEIKSENYSGDFELIGSMMIDEIEQKTFIRSKTVYDFGTYIIAIDNGGCDIEDVISTERLYKINTPEFKKVNRSQYARGTDFKQDFGEYIVKKCYIPTSGFCFIKCIRYFTENKIIQKIF